MSSFPFYLQIQSSISDKDLNFLLINIGMFAGVKVLPSPASNEQMANVRKKNNVNFIYNESQVSQSNIDKMYMLYKCMFLPFAFEVRNKIERYANTLGVFVLHEGIIKKCRADDIYIMNRISDF